MASVVFPTLRRLSRGVYVATCGDTSVIIEKKQILRGWSVRLPIIGSAREVFDTLSEAKEYAFSYLEEYA